MVDIFRGEIRYNEMNANSNGGTELLARRLVANVPAQEFQDFQIVLSRKRELEDNVIRIFWAHDLPGDPESEFIRTDPNIFHAYVFVSNWQMQAYINYYGLPWSKCYVINNFIDPIEEHEKPTGKINLVYFSTPHRGLQILVPVFKELVKRHNDIHLNVFSSFKLYGWEDSDKGFQQLFDEIKASPNMTYHGAVSNEKIREELKSQHILAYPSIWAETSCLVLMEAMSAKLLCVHPNYGALSETAARWTFEYAWKENHNEHARQFFQVLDYAINMYRTSMTSTDEMVSAPLKTALASMKSYADSFYNTKTISLHWRNLLSHIKNQFPPETRSLSKSTAEQFVYNTRGVGR